MHAAAKQTDVFTWIKLIYVLFTLNKAVCGRFPALRLCDSEPTAIACSQSHIQTGTRESCHSQRGHNYTPTLPLSPPPVTASSFHPSPCPLPFPFPSLGFLCWGVKTGLWELCQRHTTTHSPTPPQSRHVHAMCGSTCIPFLCITWLNVIGPNHQTDMIGHEFWQLFLSVLWHHRPFPRPVSRTQLVPLHNCTCFVTDI